VLRRRPGDVGASVDAATLMAGIEQLHVRVDSLEDQFRKTAGMLHVLGEHLNAGDRRAAIAERVTIAVDQEMQRLANRIDEQVTALAATAGGGSELSDGVARLTRKLRQSVTQLDRALERLDQVVDQVGGVGAVGGAGGVNAARPALLRGAATLPSNEPGSVRGAKPGPGGRLGPVARR
jgi:ABC-type transporter Mla subunit MlaD